MNKVLFIKSAILPHYVQGVVYQIFSRMFTYSFTCYYMVFIYYEAWSIPLRGPSLANFKKESYELRKSISGAFCYQLNFLAFEHEILG